MTQSKPLRYTNGILSFLFIVFAAFQVNDVDPEIYHNPSKLDAGLWLVFYALIGVMLIVGAKATKATITPFECCLD